MTVLWGRHTGVTGGRLYYRIHCFLLIGLRGKIERNSMNLWDRLRYQLVLWLPLPK